MERVSIGDFPIALAQAALGASGAIEIGMTPFHPDWIEYVEDMAQLVDSRLLRRMLLPGYSDFGWSRPDDALLSEAFLGRLRPFLENGWEVRTAPYSRLGFAVIVDRERAFHAYPSGRRGRRDGDVPEVTERVGERELAEFLSEFDHGWSVGSPFVPIYSDPQSVDLSETELLLRVEVSDDQFRDLIQYLARNPERMREMDPRRFEEFVADLFAREGFDVELTPLSGDGGRDILVSSVSDLGPLLHLVGVQAVRRRAPGRRVPPAKSLRRGRGAPRNWRNSCYDYEAHGTGARVRQQDASSAREEGVQGCR